MKIYELPLVLPFGRFTAPIVGIEINKIPLLIFGAVLLLAGVSNAVGATGTVVGWGQNAYDQATNSIPPGTVIAIAAGSDDTTPNSIGFSLGVKPDGTLIGWGNNTYGQSVNFPGGATNIVAIAAGEYHAMALRADGKVFAWGRDNNGQTNVPAMLASNVVAITAGSCVGDHSLAIRTDGTVVGWGYNDLGQITVPSGATNVVQVVAGGADSMALRADGTLVAWGGNSFGQTNVPASATNIVAIAAGTFHFLALRTNGTVLAWGENTYGQTTVPASASNVVAIAGGDEHSMALRRDGTVVAWGNNSYSFGVPAGLTNVVAITSAARHALAIVSDGTPAITLPPRNQTAYPGGRAVFVAFAAGSGNLSYQWQANGINIPGATSPILVLTNVQPANSGWYQVTVRNSFGYDTASAGLTLLDGQLSITQQLPGATAVDANSNATLSVSAVGALPISFQWWKNGSPIVNATNSSYTITNAQTASAGAYSVIFSNSYGSLASSTDIVSVAYFTPVVITQPVGTNVAVGNPFTLNVSVTGTSPFTYQWRNSTVPIPGATASNYVDASAQLTDAGSYDVVVSNSVGGTNSIAVAVNVGYPPVVTQQPLPLTLTVNAGAMASFSSAVTGSVPINLQWTLNGYAVTNQTNSGLNLTNVQPANIGYYAVVATNLFGSTISSNAALNVNGYNFSQWAGLVAYYALNGDAIDSSGNGNNGTNINVVPTTDRFGNPNGAMFFAGTNNCIQIKAGAYFGTRFTISAWVDELAYQNWSRVIDFGNGAAQDNTLFAISYSTDGWPDLEAYAGTTRIGPFTAPVFPLNKWTQLVAIWDGARISYYFNGGFQNGYTATLSRGLVTTSLNYIGRSNWRSAGDADYYGSFDDIRIFNRTLSSNDVAQLFALESVPPAMPGTLAATISAGLNNLSLSLTGIAGSNYVLQSATNLTPPVQWTPIVTNTAGTNGLWQAVDTNLSGAQKFYRVTTP